MRSLPQDGYVLRCLTQRLFQTVLREGGIAMGAGFSSLRKELGNGKVGIHRITVHTERRITLQEAAAEVLWHGETRVVPAASDIGATSAFWRAPSWSTLALRRCGLVTP